MAPHGWRKSPSVGAWLAERGADFDFLQAVALLENARPDAASVGTGSEALREAVRFRASIAMSFPGADIERIRLDQRALRAGPERDGETARESPPPAEITATFLGLAGAIGPLPPPFAELIARRTMLRDTALRDFLDIFHHRLLSIFYQVRKRHRLGVGVASPERDDAARYLFALIGLGTPGLTGRMAVPDRALLFHAGILSRSVRTMAGLEVILRTHFRTKVEGIPFKGALCTIEPDDRTRIGRSGQRRALGRDAMIGSRVWIQDAAFEVVLGPLPSEELPRFLPGGDALLPLCAIIDLYAGDVTDYTVRLRAGPGAVREARLGRRHDTRLGYTSWLLATGGVKRKPPQEEIVLSRATLAPYRRATSTARDGRGAASIVGSESAAEERAVS